MSDKDPHMVCLPPGVGATFGSWPTDEQWLAIWNRRVRENEIRNGYQNAPKTYKPEFEIPAFLEEDVPNFLRPECDAILRGR